MIGVGAQDDFEGVQSFLDKTGMKDTPMLWEQTGNIWRIQNANHNSAMQLFSFDLSQASGIIFFNERGRQVVLDASTQYPWAAGTQSSP